MLVIPVGPVFIFPVPFTSKWQVLLHNLSSACYLNLERLLELLDDRFSVF